MTSSRTPRESTVVQALDAKERIENVREAYKKHGAELLAIEEAQQKITLVLLGIFGAGASFLASSKDHPLATHANLGLTMVVVAIVALAAAYTNRRNKARASVRDLMVACEEAFGFFAQDAYVRAATLYPVAHVEFRKKGWWLGWGSFAAVLLGAAGFLLVLWYR